MGSSSQLAPAPASTGEAFFASYDWCLNPVLSVRDVVQRADEESRRYGSLEPAWQREESRINLYLLLCAASCTADDYLAYRPWRLEAISNAIPRLRPFAGAGESLLNAPHAWRTFRDRRRVQRWRQSLNRCVDRVCEFLVDGSEPGAQLLADFRTLSSAPLPPDLLGWRMRIPEGFRCQDLSHHDVLAMARRFVRDGFTASGPVLVVGLRSAGGYFAPLVQACLKAEGVPVSGWMTFRPKLGASRDEKKRFGVLMAGAAQVLVVDDHPNTGGTITRTLALLRRLGVPADQVVILAPEHAAQRDWRKAAGPAAVVTLPESDFHKQELLNDPAAIASILRELCADRGCCEVRIEPSGDVDRVNARLWSHNADGFQVRLKRLFEVKLLFKDQPPVIKHVLAKGVGWGWLGYHAFVAGRKLAGYVPPVLGLRNGLLFMEWVGGVAPGRKPPTRWNIVSLLPFYVAERVRRLRLQEDPCLPSPGGRWTGRDTLVQSLRRVYGPWIGRLKAGAIRTELEKYASPVPVMLDGRMGPEEWISDGGGTYKVDFEQHNFGGAEQDLVDPAYDLACAIYELDLSEQEERSVLGTYVQQSGDPTVSERVLLYKLLSGFLAMKTATYRLARDGSPEMQQNWNRRYLSARDFLIRQMNRHSAKGLAGLGPPAWSPHLFFLDLDGVLDWNFLGFPHTTPSGVRALRLLRSHGYSVVLNTGRSIGHVRSYCESYGLPGGVAEYGSVFLDAVRGVETPLVDAEAKEQLVRCRELLEKIPGVFTDPNYEWSARAYRYRGQTTLGLDRGELEKLLFAGRLDKLRFICGSADSHIVQKDLDKGAALRAVKEYVPGVQDPVVAMGDSVHDLEMLEQAGIAYLPANRSQALRRLRGDSKYRVMRQPLQRGLLEAVQHLLGEATGADEAQPDHLVDALLRAAERRTG